MVFFFIAKETFAPIDLKGVMPKMCMTVRMKIDVEDYENETNKLISQAHVLVENDLMEITQIRVSTGEFTLTDKGELYILQKILRPLIEIKDNDKLSELRQYIQNKDDDVKSRIEKLLDNMQTQDPQKSIMEISTLILSRAMPFLTALNLLHEYAKSVGLF